MGHPHRLIFKAKKMQGQTVGVGTKHPLDGQGYDYCT
jgi:hypothetical protein